MTRVRPEHPVLILVQDLDYNPNLETAGLVLRVHEGNSRVHGFMVDPWTRELPSWMMNIF